MIEKYELINKMLIQDKSKNPIEVIKKIMHQDFINIHGSEHHFLDGAAFLVAFKNSGGDIDLPSALGKLKERTIKMPGAMCGLWGICGSTSSIGAALSIIHGTEPLSNDEFYKDHMKYTSNVISKMSEIGGPRCCKRNAFISLRKAIEFVKENYYIEMELSDIKCEFTNWNKQCIKERCPFYKKEIEESTHFSKGYAN
ncbi:MAG: DUF5714 domain-containing protein [Anaeroplasma bactoclasticum]|nr:DUF5714 domain-containing protein [Anaeroplasma bactoclasticum]